MNGEQIGRALAFATGDMRDWPWACANCGSEDVMRRVDRNTLMCAACRCETTMHIAVEYQYERASREVTGRPVKPMYPFEKRR